MAEPTYDLALAGADYPTWTGAPRRTIAICGQMRSGSTLLGEALYFAGDLGCPLEYLHRGFRPGFARMWNADTLAGYVEQLHHRRTDPGGTLSIKLFWQDVEETAHEAAPDRFPPAGTAPHGTMTDADYRDIASLLHGFLPAPEYLLLERKDRVRQAISIVRAAQTGLWRSIPGQGPQAAQAPVEYDYEKIASAIAFIDYSNDHWTRFFAANGISPIRVAYEDLFGRYADVVPNLLAGLGSKCTGLPEIRMRRQSDATSQTMLLRFLADHAARTAEGSGADDQA